MDNEMEYMLSLDIPSLEASLKYRKQNLSAARRSVRRINKVLEIKRKESTEKAVKK